MQLPNGDRAIIDTVKLTGYCLNLEHEDGQHKARLFNSVLGLTLDDVELLLVALRNSAANCEATAGRQDKYGLRFQIDFSMNGPTGTATVRSAWIVRSGEDVPRLVTCYII